MKKPRQRSLEGLVRSLVSQFEKHFQRRMAIWGSNLAEQEAREVIGALIARQVTLAIQLVGNPGIWNGHAAPILLRAMADVHITLVWIIAQPNARSKEFVAYGLGQQKLEVEHRRADLASRQPFRGEEERLIAVEAWIDSQRVRFLVEVNIGSWSGKSTREMAQEAGCIDFYNYVYVPFSSCSHSAWHHVSRYNLRVCRNPLHRYHFVPFLSQQELDVHYAYLATKYAAKSLSAFDSFAGLNIKGKSLTEWFDAYLA